jgi:uncharacterized protein YbjT (DUF2867 family)
MLLINRQNTENMRAMVIGATGMTGSNLLKRLLLDPRFTEVTVLGRNSCGLQAGKLVEKLLDLTNEPALRAAFPQADVCFCCIGTTTRKVKGNQAQYRKIDLDIPVLAAKLCRDKKFNAFIMVSAVGANPGSRNFYLRLKGQTEAAIKQQHPPVVYFMQPGMLTGNREEFRLAEKVAMPVMTVVSHLLTGRLTRYKSIAAGEVASAMVEAAFKNEKGVFTCTYKEMKALTDDREPAQ